MCNQKVFKARRVLRNYGTSIYKKKRPFSPRYSKNYILNGKCNPKMDIIRAFFPKLEYFFGWEASSLFPRCAPMSVAKYLPISLNILKYLWKCLNKLFWLKKNFMAPFYGWGSTASRLEPLRGGSLLFTTKFPEIPGT